jgi:ABC-2 type transport system permease protein
MNTPLNAVPESPLESQAIAPAAPSATRPLYWSVRRELWENHSIYVGPLAVAAFVLLGFSISAIHHADKLRGALALDSSRQHDALTMPYHVAAFLIILTAFIVGVFYSLDALHAERRDRSILFWKSLPVSDLTTVLSKASIPLVVLPLVIFPIIVATQGIMLPLHAAVLRGGGLSAAPLWTQLHFFASSLALLYALAAMTLWYAPIYGWLLVVSGWARRATFLWAVLPPLAICVVEKFAFNTEHFASFLKYRLVGWYARSFMVGASGTAPANPLKGLDPGKFLSTPGLWFGLIVAVLFFAAAVRLRRYRGPI